MTGPASRPSDAGLFVPMLRLENICYRYPGADTLSIDDISLTLSPGEAVCLMGNNGSGKSTFAHLIAGLIRQDAGRISFETGSDGRPEAGLLFQDPDNQMVAMIVEKEIAFGLENRAVPMADMDPLVSEELEKFGILPLRRRLTTELSGGEKQLVCLSSVLITKPRILILDEPDAFLDDPSRELLERQLRDISRQNPELIEIRITQDIDVVRNYHRLIVLKAGQIAADGSPDDLLNNSEAVQAMSESRGISVSIASLSAESKIGNVEMRDVSFCYGPNSRQLASINLRLSTGEIVGLRGPTGSGKSTIGLLLCGLLKPDSGKLAAQDRNGNELDYDCMGQSVVGAFQQPERQFFLPSCAEEIRFGPANFGRELADEAVLILLQQVGLAESFADREPSSLSVGEKRRLAFACLLALDSGLLVFDEPTAGLDLHGQRLFAEMVRSLKASARGLLVISHDSRLLDTIADRNYRLQDGHLTEMIAGVTV